MAIATNYHRVLASDSRARLLEVLRAAGEPLSIVELAMRVDLKPVTARFHLDMLVSAGLVQAAPQRRGSPGRPSLLYSAVTRAAAPSERGAQPVASPGVPAEATGGANDYEELARVLADQLSQTPDPARAAREAGRRWTHALETVDTSSDKDALATILDLMARLGFAPDREAGSNEIALHRCPFEAVAREHRQIVCSVHQGMIEESLARLGGKAKVSSFRPFVSDDPLLCTVGIEQEPEEPESR